MPLKEKRIQRRTCRNDVIISRGRKRKRDKKKTTNSSFISQTNFFDILLSCERVRETEIQRQIVDGASSSSSSSSTGAILRVSKKRDGGLRSFGTKDTTTTTTTTQQQLSQSEFGRVFFLDKKIVGPFEWKNVSSLTLKEYYKQRV